MKTFYRLSHKLALGLSLAVILALFVVSLAYADNVEGDDLIGGNNVIKNPGQTGTAISYLKANGNDGCNVNATYPATANVVSDQSWLTINSPGSVSFTACGVLNAVTIDYSVSSSAPIGGEADVEVYSVTGGIAGNNGWNLAASSFTVKIAAPSDSIPPMVTVSFPAPTGANGWFNTSPVSGSVVASDTANVSAISCTDSAGGLTQGSLVGGGTTNASRTLSVSGEGTHNISCTATDGANNSGAGSGSSNTATVKIDTIAPSISGSVSPAVNGAGWNNSDVTVSFTCGDAMSGIASCSAPTTLGKVQSRV